MTRRTRHTLAAGTCDLRVTALGGRLAEDSFEIRGGVQ